MAPRDPAPRRTRHQARAPRPGAARRKVRSTSRRLRTRAVAGAGGARGRGPPAGRARGGGGGGEAEGGEPAGEAVLVRAQLDQGGPRQEEVARQPGAQPREREGVHVGGGDDQVDRLRPRDPSQGARPRGSGGRRPVAPIRGGVLQDERVVVTADDGHRRVTGAKAADEVVAGTGSGARDEKPLRHLTSTSCASVVRRGRY